MASGGYRKAPTGSVLPMNTASAPKPCGVQRRVQCLTVSRQFPWPWSILFSSHFHLIFLIALGKTLVTTKQTASLSRPVWRWHAVRNAEQLLQFHLFLSKKSEDNVHWVIILTLLPQDTGTEQVRCVQGWRIGPAASGPWGSTWPSICCSWRPLGLSQVLLPDGNFKHYNQSTCSGYLFVIHESVCTPLESVYILCFYLPQG